MRALPAEAWIGAELRKEYQGSAHAAADTLLLRWPNDRSLEAAFRDLNADDLPLALELCPELSAVTCNLTDRVGKFTYTGRCMITRLAPGGRIEPHIDEGIYADVYDRFHVCLAGSARFRCGTEAIEPEPGQAFWFNRKLMHSVENGPAERLHLILDLEAPQYLKARGVYVQQEPLEDAWPDMEALFRAHYEEIAHYKDIALAPNAAAYRKLASRGVMRAYTVRDAGDLVGYAVFLVRRNPHYWGSLQAIQDVLYLEPAYRRGMTGVRLLRHAEERLRAEGVQVVYHHVKRTNRMGELLERLGYEHVDQVYAKRLDKKKGE